MTLCMNIYSYFNVNIIFFYYKSMSSAYELIENNYPDSHCYHHLLLYIMCVLQLKPHPIVYNTGFEVFLVCRLSLEQMEQMFKQSAK